MAAPRHPSLFSQYALDYDRLQPVRIEMYRFYHDLAHDLLPFQADDGFRFLDLGCGSGVFASQLLKTFPRASGVALDLSAEMLAVAAAKTDEQRGRVAFRQADLSERLSSDLGQFDLVTAFSAIHHLTDARKRETFAEIVAALRPSGWFFYIDAMSVRFDDSVFATWKQRSTRRLEERFDAAGLDIAEERTLAKRLAAVPADSPERDRISDRDNQFVWLREAGFSSVDYVWHLFKEHFVICRR